MSYMVKVGESRTYTIQNRKIHGFMLNVGLLANATANAFVPSDFDATKIFVTANLLRQGKKITLFADNLAATIAGSFDTNFALLHPANGGTPDNVVLVQTTGVTEKHVLPYFLDFGSVIDLEGEDKIEVTVQFTASALVGTYLVGGTTSYVDIMEMEELGFEKFTPVIETNTIKSGESRISFSLGDHIKKIVLLNYDKDNLLAASAPTASISLSSDKINYQKTSEQAMAERQKDTFLSYSEEIKRRHSLVLYDGKYGNLNKCQLELLLNSANIAVGKNVLVVWRALTSPGLLLHGNEKEQMVKNEKLAKLGFKVDATKKDLSGYKRTV